MPYKSYTTIGPTSLQSSSISIGHWRNRIIINERHIENSVTTHSAARPSPASAVMMYIDSLPNLVTQARKADNPWNLFRQDERFVLLHPLLEKLMCVPAASAPVEHVFSHGGLFMRPHRARLGQKLLAELVFAKCNKHIM